MSLDIFMLLSDVKNASDVIKCLCIVTYPNDIVWRKKVHVFFWET